MFLLLLLLLLQSKLILEMLNICAREQVVGMRNVVKQIM